MRKHIEIIIRHPLFSGSAIMIVGSNSASVINTVFHLVTGRLLGPSAYGELVALISVIGLLGIIPGAVSLFIVKQISSAKNKQEAGVLIDWFKTKMFTVSLLFSFFVLVCSPLTASFLHIYKFSYLGLIALFFLFSLQTGFNRSMLQGLLKFKEMVISVLAENGVKLIVSVILIYLGFQVEGALFTLLISAVFGLYITNSYLNTRSSNVSNFTPNIKSMMKYTIPVALQTIAVTSLYTTDVILVKHFFPPHEAGIYAALSTLGKISFFGTGPISTVMFPLVSQRKANGQSYREIFIYSFIATALLSLSISIIYFLVPKIAINMLYGEAYLEAEKLLVWFGIFISFFTLSFSLINYSLSLGKTRVTILPLIASVVQIISIIFFHQTLFIVIYISVMVTALLLLSLIIYSIHENKSSV